MTIVSYQTGKIRVNFGGVEYNHNAPDQNTKTLEIGGGSQPTLSFPIEGASKLIPFPSGDYEDEPYTVYLNGYIAESGTLPSPDTPEVWSVEISTPNPANYITAGGTATAVVRDQFGDVMVDGFSLAWSKTGAIASINEGTGVYTVTSGGVGGAATITAVATDSSTSGTASDTKTYSVRPASVVTSVKITAPEDDATISEGGTATAKVLDQYGEQMLSESVTWSSSETDYLTIVEETGVYSVVADGEVEITATSSTDGTKSATVAVTVDATPAQNDS